MSAHVRTQIRVALALHLEGAGLPSGRVHAARRARLDPAGLPCVVVGTPSEQVDRVTVGAPTTWKRRVAVVVDAYVAAEPLETTADALALKVERCVAQAGRLGGLVKAQLLLTEVQTDLDDTVSPPLARVRMTYLAETITASDAPGVALLPTGA